MKRFLTYAVLFIAISFGGCQCSDSAEATRAAEEYAKNIPGATGKVSCTQTDSDGDGYCSCSAFMEDGTIRMLNCGCEKYCINCARGCKSVENVKLIGK